MFHYLKRHLMFGAIGGAVATVAVIAIAGVIFVFFAAAAGAAVGAVLGLVVGIVRAPFKLLMGKKRRDRIEVEVRPPM